MALFEPDEWSFAEQAADLVATNPFQPGWRAQECALLGKSARDAEEDYSWRPGWGLWGPGAIHPDVDQLGERISDLAEEVWRRLQNRARATERELSLYETLALFRLYRDHGEGMDCFIDSAVPGRLHQPGPSDLQEGQGSPGDVKSMWKGFLAEYRRLFHPGYRFPLHFPPEHVFACFFLFRRAVYHIFYHIVGTSKPITRLRAAVWESVVTHDFRDWSRSLYRRMRDFPTLITGPSGTGKELVAQAIGRSLYIPFDPAKKAFAFDFLKAFNPVNLSALPPLLIESELFGHVKGAFSGAIDHRVGRLEQCPENGAVFLDECGELTPEIQVKLLRVLQERRFQRVGTNEDRDFSGKIIAATNRDLAAEMQARRFREDLYYRLCADLIATPSLHEQLTDRPEDLGLLVEFACRRVVGEDSAAEFSREVVKWIRQNLRGHTWPGNFRELEQCVRSYTIRKEYHPARLARTRAGEGSSQPPGDPVAGACETLAGAVLEEKTTFEKIKRRLFTLVLAATPTAKEAARRLGLDYRTVQAWVTGSDDRSADG